MKEHPIRKRTSPVPKTAKSESKESVNLILGRLKLKELYFKHELLFENEESGNIQMPEDQFLALIPYFESEGLTAAEEFILFTSDGILLKGCENVIAHNSREKLALFYLILSYECKKPIQMNRLLKDELFSLQSMLQLVDWVSTFKSEKDIRRILERDKKTPQIIPAPLPIIENEKPISLKHLALELKVSERTITRYPEQFPFIYIGSRKYYFYSECVKHKKIK